MNRFLYKDQAAVSQSPSNGKGSKLIRKSILFGLFTLPFLFLSPEFILSATIRYTYDTNGRLIREQFEDYRIISYSIDPGENILTVNSFDPEAHTDQDGVADGVEMGPQGNDPTYDGDGNGIPDYQEARAASLPTSLGGQYATIFVPAGLALVNVRAVTNPSPGNLPENLEFPYGFFEFTVTGLINGGCTVARLRMPEDHSLKAYYKYSGTPDNTTPRWYPFEDDGITGAAISHQNEKTTITLSICDDRRGDGDLHLNGIISDPGGPARIENTILYLPLIFR
jgi:hypothetical protein